MKKIGVILSGCGHRDGGEIHESVLTLYFLSKAGAEAVMMAPDKDQADVVDHLSGKTTGERRNVLVEAARIARGNVRRIKEIDASQLDGLILPGGFGAAKNLSTFARDGAGCSIDPDVAAIMRGVHSAGKPIGAICIAPAVAAKVFGADLQPELTIGNDAGTAKALETMGARHKDCAVTEAVIDRKNKIVTTPAYMLAKTIAETGAGIERLVRAVLEMA